MILVWCGFGISVARSERLGASTLLLLLLLLLRYNFWSSLATTETNGTVLRSLSSERYIFLAPTYWQEAEYACILRARYTAAHSTEGIEL